MNSSIRLLQAGIFITLLLSSPFFVHSQSIKPKCYSEKEYNSAIQDFYLAYADDNSTFFVEKRINKNGLKAWFGGTEKKSYRLIKYDKDFNEIFAIEYTPADLGGEYEVFRLARLQNTLYLIAAQENKGEVSFKFAAVDLATGKPVLPMKDMTTLSMSDNGKSASCDYVLQPTVKGDKLCLIQYKISESRRQYNIAVWGDDRNIRKGAATFELDKFYAFNSPNILVDDNYIYIGANEYDPGKRKRDDVIFNNASIRQYAYSGELKQRFAIPDSGKVPLATRLKLDEANNRLTVVSVSNPKAILATTEKICISRFQLSDAKLLDFTAVDFEQQKLPIPATPVLDKKGNETGEVSYVLPGKMMLMDIVEENGKLYIPMQHQERYHVFSSSGSRSSILNSSTETFAYSGDIVVFCFDDHLKPLWGSKIPRRQRENIYMYDGGFKLNKTSLDLDIVQDIKSNAFPSMPLYGGTAYTSNTGRLDFYFNELPENIHKNRSTANITELDSKTFDKSSLYRFSVDKGNGEVKYQLVSRNTEEQMAMPAKVFSLSGGTLLIPSTKEKIRGTLSIIFCKIEQ